MPTTLQKIQQLTRQLYPRARAWVLAKNSIFAKFHEALAESEKRLHDDIVGLIDSVLPDNNNFTETDAERWEQALGLITDNSVSLELRKQAIQRKINHPGNILARQHYKYIEGQLRAAGFDVYIHENRFPDGSGGYEVNNLIPAIFGEMYFGQTQFGDQGIGDYTILANHIDPAKDEDFNLGDNVNLRFTFFVGGSTFGDRAEVPLNRLWEFRELILSLKPAQTAGGLLVDYV